MFSYPVFRFGRKKRFGDLSEREVLALAISSEEEDGAIYSAYAETLRADYPASATVFEAMSAEEDTHRKVLIELYRRRFRRIHHSNPPRAHCGLLRSVTGVACREFGS